MQDFSFDLQRFVYGNNAAPYGFLSRDDKDQIDTLLNTRRDIRVDLSKKTVVDINTSGDFTLGIQSTLPVDSGGTGVGNLNNITVGGAARDANGNVLTTTYAPLASPALTGSPTATTATEGDSSTRIATTAFVTRAIKTLIGTAPAILDTLGEISAAINADANVYQTLNEAKQPRHAALTSISGLSTAANQMIYTTAANAYTTTSLTAYARTLLDDADAATARNTLDVPSKTGSGASGTWGISISGTAAKATADANGATIASTYLKLSGGTMTGAVTFANNTFNTVGDDAQIGDFNVAGTLGVRGANGTTGLALLKQGSTSDYALLSYNGANLISNKTITANLAGNASTATTATTAGNVTGTVAIANGGTGATTAAAARQNLFGSAMNTSALAKYVITINDSWASGGYTTLQQLRNFMGLGDTTSYLPVANGGTGTNSLANITVGKASQLATARTISLTGAVTGSGTFDGTGNLTITTSEPIHSFTGNGYYDIGGIARTSGGTDYARIRFGQTVSDKGYLEIAIADNGDEPIYVRQYKYDLQSPSGDPNTTDGAFKYIYRTVTLLDASGNSTFPGTITAAGFSGNATNVTGTISIAHGGTGATTAAAALTALGAAAASHGNHVPATQTANNATFLRNDNTWQKVTPANIGAAASSHTHDYAASSHNHSTDNITSGTLSIARGGTGQTTTAAVRNALGLGNTTGALPIANGGTGATTAAAALTNLGAAAASHTHSYAATNHSHGAGDITSGTLSIARGGTGASTAAAARTALGAAASDHVHSNYAASSHTHSEYAALSGAAFTGTIKSTAGATLGATGNIEVVICQGDNDTLLVGRNNNKIVLGGLQSSVYVGTGLMNTITIGDSKSSINIGNDNFNTINVGTGTDNVIKIGNNIVTIQGSNASLGSNTYYNGKKLSELGGNVDLSSYAKLSGAAFTGSISNNDNATLGNMNYGQVKLVPNTNGSVYIGSSSNTSANGSQFYDYSRYFYAGDIAGSKINIGCKGGSSIQVGRSSNSTVNMGAASARIELGQASSTIGVGDYANTHVTIGASGSQIHLIGTAYYNGTPLGSGSSSSSYYGVCSTAAGTAAKTVSVTGFSLITGVLVTVKFSNSITVANPTLNVNSTGAKTIYYRGYALPANAIEANSTYTLVYNGTQWEIVGSILSTS